MRFPTPLIPAKLIRRYKRFLADVILPGGSESTVHVAELCDYGRLRREVRYGKASRIDFLLEQNGRPPCYVEVKNVHMMRAPGRAEFPDSVTARGTKHLAELADAAKQGSRAVMLFVVQIGSAQGVALARDIDPAYGAAFDQARAAGVEAIAFACRITTEGIEVDRSVPVLG